MSPCPSTARFHTTNVNSYHEMAIIWPTLYLAPCRLDVNLCLPGLLCYICLRLDLKYRQGLSRTYIAYVMIRLHRIGCVNTNSRLVPFLEDCFVARRPVENTACWLFLVIPKIKAVMGNFSKTGQALCSVSYCLTYNKEKKHLSFPAVVKSQIKFWPGC